MPSKWFKVRYVDYYNAVEAPTLIYGDKNKSSYLTGETWPDVVKLKNGQLVDVKWPDKSIQAFRLKIVKSNDSAQIDMNNIRDYYHTQQLFVVTNINGAEARVPLFGRVIRRVEE